MKYKPVAAAGTAKYSTKGNFTKELFQNYDIPDRRRTMLQEAANHSLSKSTWSTYKTAERMLAMCRKDEKKKMDLPLSEEDILTYIGWLLEVRNVKARTISGYLSGLRLLHITKGAEPPEMRTNLVKCILTGKTNMENIETRKSTMAGRLPMTMTMMRVLKEQIRLWEEPMQKKLLMWAVCSLAFHGAFRIHEILSKTSSTFDPDFVLLHENLSLKREFKEGGDRFLEVVLKCPKESRTGKAVVIEVFETKGALCPVKAYERWQSRTKAETGMPAFREDDGTPLTGTKLNGWLRNRLEKFIDYKKGKFTSHSFRIGLATTLGTRGCSNDDIKEAGRWNSNSYEVYMRLPRNRRAKVAKKIGRLI